MIEIYYGRAGTGKTEQLFERMCDHDNVILVVPEQLSITRETEIQTRGIRGVQVLSFSRLANTVFRTLGGTAKKHPDNAMRAAAVHLAVDRVFDELCYFKTTAHTPGFVTALMSAFTDFDQNRMTEQGVLAIPDCELSARTKSKYRDMFTVYHAYKEVWSGEYKDPADDMASAAALLELHDIYRDTVFMFDGFFGFTEQQLQLISQIMLQAPLCIFAFTTDTKSPLFTTVNREIKKLTRVCSRLGFKVNMRSVGDTPHRLISPALRLAEREAFDMTVTECDEAPDGITVYGAANINDELDYVACRIKNDVLCGKYRYRDIAVLCPGADSVRHLARAVFDKHGIPLFTDTDRTLLSQPLCAMVLSALDIALRGFEPEWVFAFLKTGLTGIPFDGIARLESYIHLWNIRDKNWREPQWTRDPAGMGGFKQKDEELLLQLNETKNNIYTKLSAFKSAVSGKRTGGQLLQAVYQLTEDFCVKDNLTALAADFKAAGELQLFDEYTRVYSVFVDLLDSIYAIYGQEPIDCRRFYELFSVCASAVTLSGRPSRTDEVLFAATGRARAEGKRCVYIPRMNSSYIPAVKKPSPLITDADKRVFERHDIAVSLDTQMSAYREHFDFYYAAMSPSHELILSYSAFTATGDPLPRSEYLELLQKATGVKTMTANDLPRDFFLVSLSGATKLASQTRDPALFKAIERAGGLTVSERTQNDTLTDDIVEALYSRHLRLSFTGMETYVNCPFRFFMDKGLRAEVYKPVAFNANDIGTFIHKGLENMLSGDYDISTDAAVADAVNVISDEYYNTALADMKGRSRRFDYMFDRAKKAFGDAAQCVAADLRTSDFKPHDFEVDISKYGDPVDLGGGYTLTLVGSIDRVDMTDDGYARVIDYKSGSQRFSFDKMYNGLSLQLPVYASAIKAKDPDIKIAAMYYLKVGVPDANGSSELGMSEEKYAAELSKYYARDGIFSTDGVIAPRLNTDDPAIKKDRLFTDAQINRLIDFTKERIRQTGAGITSGCTDVSPLTEKACKYCDYRTVCNIAEKGENVRKEQPLPDDFLKEDE